MLILPLTVDSSSSPWLFLSNDNTESSESTLLNILFSMFTESFPMKAKIFFNESQEFYTEKLVMLKRKKKNEFKKHRRSEKYLSLHLTYKAELRKAKGSLPKKKIADFGTMS